MGNLRIKDIALENRPRERLIRSGPQSLSNAELLAIILRTGSREENVIDLSNRILSEYNLKKLSETGFNEIRDVFGIGDAKACQIIALFELSNRISLFPEEKEIVITIPYNVFRLLNRRMSSLKKEHLIGLYLNTKNALIHQEVISIGILNANLIHPREIFKSAIKNSAASIILAHNHPSGDPKPSREDIEVTKRLQKAGEILQIKVLDHVIIGNNSYFSFNGRHLL